MAAPDRPLLAVCIPTHHGRAGPLSDLLDRLLPQLPPDGLVEVCISDNASEDGTEGVVAARGADDGALRYVRHERNLGLVENMLAVVEMARADYCWLLGSDDAPADEAIPRLIDLLVANAGVSGAHLGFQRCAPDDLDMAAPDLAPDILPPDPGTRRLHSVESYVSECGVLSLPLSLNVVRRELWQTVVAEERRVAERTPIVPQVYITGRMMQRNPDWLWAEGTYALVREAPNFLEEQEEGYMGPAGSDLGRQLRVITADLDRVWATLYGRGSAQHRDLMRRFGRFALHPAAAVMRKLYSRGTAADEVRYLGFVRHFWHSPDFRRKTLPLLLTPTARLRAPDPPSARDDADPAEEQEGSAVARVTGPGGGQMIALPDPALTGRGAWAEVFVENIGDRILSFTGPHHAALYARWTDRDTGQAVDAPMYVTPLYPPLRPGRRRRLEQLLTVPDPGSYELMIDLFDRATGRTLTNGRPVMGRASVEAR